MDTTIDLVQWLRAQLDEDERDAPNIHSQMCFKFLDPGGDCSCDYRDRVLREVEAKRRILDEYEKARDRRRLFRDDMASAGALLQMVAVVKLLALPYSDRPGYQEAWRP